ncbi:ankyrin repeat protein [Trichoderma atroviride IMI 206040]|uniref:Ankyrin repeat protein n=1 Tax=Hypocrea atroviridis (strain ATCC 20476 / IMI 206040) TaxID=452589 RepID=G9NMK2_HYPAI|nr:ankyrin repeat protein [Trichoderma atroviride IMI 206040]EHK48132.1 ankyrin repeat protein [Trichoderma atroviride IMI 206040]
MEANLVLSIGEVPQELEAEFERPSNKDQDDNMDTLSVKTTTDQIFDESTEPQTDLDQRKLGLSIVRNLGWSGSNYDDYDVVTVHGICDDYRTAWIDGEGSWWVKTKLFQDLSTRQIDYSYEIHGDSELYEIDGLRLHAERLMTSYAKIRGELEETEKDRPIIWVCHDLGGTIVKEALSMALARPDKFGKIAVQTTSIVFLGTPHRFQSMEDLEDQVLALIMLQGSAIRTQLVRKVKRLANQVERANQKFLSTKLFDRATIFNVFAQNIHDTRNHQLFDGKTPYATVTKNDHDALGAPAADTAFSSLTYAVGHSFESVGRYGLGKLDHLHMVSGDGPDESWVSRIFKMFNMGGCPIKINYQLLPLQASLLSLAPPTRQFDTPYDTMVPKHAIISWIMKQRSFLELRKTDNRPKVIHLHGDGSPQIDIREISQHLYVGYDDSNATSAGYRIPSRSVVYFEFDRLDSRYNSISSMLLYFINILSWRFLTPHNWLGEWENVFRVTKSCSLERIWHLYGEMLPSQDIQELTFFISCFDQCPEEERKWFSQGILSRQGHGEITPSFILSTSRKDDLAIESLPDDRRINLQECPALVRPTIRNMLANEFRSGLINLIARRPVYEIVQLLLETLLEQCSDTPFLGFVILRWLGNYRRGASKSEIAELLRQLSPVTVDNTVRVIISSLGTEDQARAINIYKWIKYAAEPWTAESLSEALTVQQQLSEESTVEKEPLLNDIDPTDLILNIEQVFGGIFIILNRDIKFSHPSFYNVCIDGPVRQDEVEREKVNGEIATACLRYFKLKGAQEKLATLFPGSLDGGPWATLLDAKVIAHQRDSMAEYAIRFWPQHYNASGIFRPSSLVRDLFSDRAARAAWEVPFFFFSNPLTRINRSYVSSLPVFAMLGLEDLIHEDVESHKNLPGFSKDCWYAITEASRVGKKAIVQRLLDQLPVDEDELRNALFWAAAYGKDGTADILIQHIPDLSSFQWPEHILHQAAVAGLDNILAALIKAGHNMNEPGPFWGASAVALAVWGNHTSTVESLIHSDAKIDLSAIDDDGDDALMQAVVMGEPHMVDIILQGGGNVHTKNNRGEGPVYKATVFSRYEALRRLLSANAGFENDQQGDAEDMGIYRRLPLLTAARYGFLECARLLLDASVARQNAHTVTIQGDVLPSTGSSSHTYITRMLLENVPIPPDTTPRSEELLIEAIKSGNVQLVSLLIEHGASINRYEAPLTAAAQNGGVEIVSLLLGKGADVNEVSMDGTRKSPLFWAIFADKVEVARLLLKRDADLSWKTELGWSLLSAAYNTPDLIPELLQKGLDPDYQCVYGSVLHMAARWGYPKTMKVLLEADPRPNLDLVYGDAEIFSESVAAGHIIQNELGLTPLLIACQSHEPECVELLLKAGADPHFHTKNDINASDILMRGGEFEKAARCLEILLSGPYGASAARKVDKKGNTLLHKIEKKTLVSVLQLLVKAGVPVDSKNQDGYTPLAFAVQRSNEAAAKYLIECGATRTGSILHLACLQGSLSLVRLLIQEGADPNAIEPEHGRSLLYTALHIDDEAACSQMVRYLVDEVKVMLDQPGGRFKYPIIRAAHMARGPGSAGLKALKFLIRRKARLDVADDQGRRAIHAAAASEWKDGLCALVEAGVDANVRDKLGRLPIHFAASVRHQDNLEYLLGRFKDINVDAADDDNWTPLLWAARTGVLDNVVQLRQRGADLWVRGRGRVQDFKSEDTWSALKLARFADRDSSWNEHLAPKDGTRINENGDEVEWNDSLHPNKLGDRKLIKCISWECRKCAGQVSLCFKCFGRREDIHDMGHAFEEIGPLYQQIASPQRRDSIANPVGVGNSSNLADGSRTYEEPETTAGGEVADNLAAVPENDASSDTDLDLDSDDLDSDSDL